MKNFIEYYQALTTEECQEIIKYINTTERLTDINHNGMKKSSDVPMNFLNDANEMEQRISNLIIARLYAAADLYKKTHNQLERIYTWGVDTSYNLQKYLPNEGPEEWEYEYLKGVTIDKLVNTGKSRGFISEKESIDPSLQFYRAIDPNIIKESKIEMHWYSSDLG